jgi:hypothetical protein
MVTAKSPILATEDEKRGDVGLKVWGALGFRARCVVDCPRLDMDALQVGPSAWKWPKVWPYSADYFSRKTEKSIDLNGPPSMEPSFDSYAAAALAQHYARWVRFTRDGSQILFL